MLEHEYFYDLIKFYTIMTENQDKFFEDNKAKMGFAGMASMASSVVASG